MRRTTRTLLTPLLLLLLLAAKPADPESLLLCTDLGPLLATRTGDGDLMGSLRGRWPVSGSDASLQIGLPGGGSWTTTLADLHPTAPVAPSAEAGRVGELLEQAGRPRCPVPGSPRFLLGDWPRPIAVEPGRRLTWLGDREALVRSPEGELAWYLHLDLAARSAGTLVTELREAFPRARVEVRRDGDATAFLVSRESDQQIGGGDDVAPEPGRGLLSVLFPPPELAGAPQGLAGATDLAWGPGDELIAAANHERGRAGLEPLSRDDRLQWAAIGHALYLDRAWAGRMHRQSSDSPWFTGEKPRDRGGAAEVVTRHPRPWRVVPRWLATPFHRMPLADPSCRSAGGGLTGEWSVMEIDRSDSPGGWTWPVDGATDVPVSWNGHEVPDPLPLEDHPDKEYPLGTTLTWEGEAPWSRLELRRSWVLDDRGRPLEHRAVGVEHPHLREAKRPVVHLLPSRPLRPGATYTWGIAVLQDGERVERQATFVTTGRSPWGPAAPPEVARGWLDVFDRVRDHLGHPPLRYDRGVQALAELGTTDSQRRFLLAELGITRWTLAADVGESFFRDAEGLDPTLLAQGDLGLLGEPHPVLIGVAPIDGRPGRWRAFEIPDPAEPAAWRVHRD